MADEHIDAGVRAFLIADVRGYTSFTQERGDVEAARLASRFAELVRECVEAAGGRVVELRGDEALCVFTSPRQALQTGVALQRTLADATREDPSLPMRVGIGIDAGEAVPVEDGFRGAALNLAARLCSLAGPGEVLAGEGIVLMAGRVDGIVYSDRGRVRVKGVRDPVRVRRLEFDLDLPPAPATEPASGRFRGTRARLTLAAAALAVAGAAVGIFLIARGGDEDVLEAAGDSAALLDPSNGRLISQFPVGATPTAVVSDDSAAWTLDADGQTISRIDPNGKRPLTKAAPGTPTSLALGGGLLWVAFVERERGGNRVGLAALDPSTLSARTPTMLPGIGPNTGDVPTVVYAAGSVWVSGPEDRLRKIDPESGRVTATLRLGAPVLGLAAGLGAVWASVGRGGVVRVDPEKARITHREHLSTPGVDAVAVGAGSVWVADPLAGVLWRLRPGTPYESHTVPIGLGASGVAFGNGSIWVASGVDGQVARVDPATEKVTRFPLGNAPLAVSVSPAGIWTAVAAAGGGSIAATPKLQGLETLAAGTCSSAVYAGSGRPDALIVSDLPAQSFDAPVTLAMVQAIEFVLRRHHFRAGRFNVAYQACDDATVAEGSYTPEKCASNAKTYAAAAAVIGVIGPVNSGCATSQIAIANSARSGPLAIVSPTASYVGLTRSGPGVSPKDPGRFYPTRIRNFARVYPPDDAQGAAGAVLAKRHARATRVRLRERSERAVRGRPCGFVREGRAGARHRRRRSARAVSRARRLRVAGPTPSIQRRRRDLPREPERQAFGAVHPRGARGDRARASC